MRCNRMYGLTRPVSSTRPSPISFGFCNRVQARQDARRCGIARACPSVEPAPDRHYWVGKWIVNGGTKQLFSTHGVIGRHCNCVTVNATGGDRAVPQTHTSGRYCLYPLARSSLYRYRALRWSRWSADLSSWRPLAGARRRSGSHSWRRRRQGGVRRGRPLLSRPRAAVGSGGPGLRACGRLLSRESDRRIDRIPLDPVVARSCVAGALVRVAMVVRFCCMIRVSPRVPVCPVCTFVSNAPISPGVFRHPTTD
jgi:hypothetical protein